MTDSKLKALVTEAVALDRELAEKTERLKELKEQLGQEAASRVEHAQPTEGGGKSLVLEGADGCIARVTTAGDTLKSSIKAEGRDIEKVKGAADRHFQRLFETVIAYKPIANFREEAASLLGAKDATKLVKLVTNPGKTTVAFETKESAAGGA
jgi:hypothetical protein